jgi:signal transduction histidine kinase
MPSRSRFASRSSIRRLGAAVAAGALAAGALERLRHRRTERRLARESSEREAERALLTAQLVTAEQDERRRLSLALHDGPLQSLSGIALMHDAALKALHDGRLAEAERLLASAVARQRETVQTLRDLSFAIEPVVLRDQGFASAVQALADQIRQATRIEVALELDAAQRLGEKAQVALYQTIREALAQAIRRGPRRIEVAVHPSPAGGLASRIADDGVAERRRASMEAIEERARILGGTVRVEHAAAGGTVVLVELPPYVVAV